METRDADALDAANTRDVQHVTTSIDAHMEALGLSVRDVARACGINVGGVQVIRTGKTPPRSQRPCPS